MKLFRGAVDTIKRVYRYEKTTGMDVGALQGVMLIFAVVFSLWKATLPISPKSYV